MPSWFDGTIGRRTAPQLEAAVMLAVKTRTFLTPLDHGAVGDGLADDTDALQRAVAEAEGGVLWLPAGRTFRSVESIRPASNTVITGPGALDILHDDTDQSTSLRVEEVENVVIDGIGLEQSNATERDSRYGLIRGWRSSGCAVRNCRLGRHSSTLAWLGLCADWDISHNFGGDSWADGVHISRGSHHIRVIGNNIAGVRDDAIAVNSMLADGAVNYPPCSDIVVADNICRDTGIIGNGVAVNGGERITVRGNVIDSPILNGIYVGAVFAGAQKTHPWRDVSVIGNVISGINADDKGVMMVGEADAHAEGAVCSGNVVAPGSEATCIYADYVDFAAFGDNAVKPLGAGHGVHLLHVTRASVTGNPVQGPGGATTSAGVLLNGCGNVVVSGNPITGCGVGVYEIASTGPITVVDNDLHGNASPVNGSPHASSVYRNNRGFNPRGGLTVPVPASGVAVAAVHYDRLFYVSAAPGGPATCVIGSASIVVPAASMAVVLVPAGVTMTPSYAFAPTWAVYGQ